MAQEEPVTVKQLNKERIRAYMGKHESASRSQIARELGLSFPTVGRLIDELCSDGELTEQGAGSSTGGRCACLYELNPLFSLYLLVQVESDRVCWNLKDMRENTVEQGCLPFEILSLEQLDALILDIHNRYQPESSRRGDCRPGKSRCGGRDQSVQRTQRHEPGGAFPASGSNPHDSGK